MWREYDDQGFLVYSFAETVQADASVLRDARDGWRVCTSPARLADGLQRLR